MSEIASNNLVDNFISEFKKLYNTDKVRLYNYFENGVFSFEQQKEIFNSLSKKQICQLFNTISLTARSNYLDSLTEFHILKEESIR